MSEPVSLRVFGRRRALLVNGSYQHRISLFTTLLAMLPPAIFFGVYYLITSEGSRRIVEASPGLEPLVRGQDRTENLLILAALLFYGLGVYLVSLMESHRTAGFLWKLDRSLQQLREGRYGQLTRPRRDDNFAFLADTTNALSRNLRARVEEDLALLGAVAECLDERLAAADSSRRDGLLELRGRVEAMRALKRSCVDDDVPPMPHAITEIHDSDQPEAPPAPLSR